MTDQDWQPLCPDGHPARIITGPTFVPGVTKTAWQGGQTVRSTPDRWQALVACEECQPRWEANVDAPAQY
jgi:hypothetical protein